MEPTIVEVLWFITGETNNISPNSIFNYFQICPDRQTLYEHLSLFRWQKKTLLWLHDDLYGKTEVIQTTFVLFLDKKNVILNHQCRLQNIFFSQSNIWF